VLLLVYGLRRGEVLGLSWDDVDLAEDVLRVGWQIQRLDGQLRRVPVKTAAGRRKLPLIPIAQDALRNVARTFERLVQASGLRKIRLHDLRHTVATLLKSLKVPPRDAMQILGHARISVTLEIYSNSDSQRDALTKMSERLFGQTGA
jgi:integrase